MKTLTQHLTTYAEYHRDRRNIATHFVGIPMIVLSVQVLLARPALSLGGVALTPGLLASVLSALFYLRLDVRFGLAMSAVLGATFAAGSALAAGSVAHWLGAGVGLFALGWAIQFVGHAFEGRKPAFVDDLVGLLVGPLFVVAETAFALGVRVELQQEIERRAGPTRVGRPALRGPHPLA